MPSSRSVPKSDIEVPSGRQMANRNSFRNSSFLRDNSVTGVDSVPADDMIARSTDDGENSPANSSMRLSAALAAEREETRIQLSKELEEEDEEEEGTPILQEGSDEDEPLTMSLMDLLEETDRKAGVEGPNYRFDGEEEEEEEVEEHVEGEQDVVCCVCLVKHKGTALVPCGHTYCRMCSREMWVQKGHCPVCSNYALEILEIY